MVCSCGQYGWRVIPLTESADKMCDGGTELATSTWESDLAVSAGVDWQLLLAGLNLDGLLRAYSYVWDPGRNICCDAKAGRGKGCWITWMLA